MNLRKVALNSRLGESSKETSFSLNKMKGLEIACLNMNGLLSKLDQLRVSCREKWLSMIETKSEPSVKDNKVNIPSYDLVCRDRINTGAVFTSII